MNNLVTPVVTFHLPDGVSQDSWLDARDVTVGMGIIWGNGARYRVADVWFSLDHHGAIGSGYNIFLHEVEVGGADDRPKLMHPDYYVTDDLAGNVSDELVGSASATLEEEPLQTVYPG
jgi:hypothetical protein